MQLTFFPGYPDLMGRKQAFVGFGLGPAVYNSTTGDPIVLPGYETYVDVVLEVPIDPTGTYYGVAQPSFNGPRATWGIHYFAKLTGTEVANASTALAAISFIVSGFASGT
jgi:hypothetical protein